ncbi:hypothetical protein FACS1894108_06840 [Planctomycetales bacterium]|nr:hypothetical protein FACS1894108_06840 [Planctomycetales bacterium]GHV18677.1 hypothetical protein AGMMS49959_01100 [Planctomycetales bacterium]
MRRNLIVVLTLIGVAGCGCPKNNCRKVQCAPAPVVAAPAPAAITEYAAILEQPAADQKVVKSAVPDAAIFNKYWKLVELNGKPVQTPEGGAEAHITLRAGGTIDGNLGCNTFTGRYELLAPPRLRFNAIIATQKMCLNAAAMTTEKELSRVLSVCDSYQLGDDGKLRLIRARMAPLAVFEAVYM